MPRRIAVPSRTVLGDLSAAVSSCGEQRANSTERKRIILLTDGWHARTQGTLLLCPHYDASAASPSPPSASAAAAVPPERAVSGGQCVRSAASGAAVCTGGSSATGTLGLVIASVDAGGLSDIMAVATPTVPPMTRVPFFNTYALAACVRACAGCRAAMCIAIICSSDCAACTETSTLLTL